MLKFSTCYDSDPPDEVVRGLIEDEKKLFPPELRTGVPGTPSSPSGSTTAHRRSREPAPGLSRRRHRPRPPGPGPGRLQPWRRPGHRLRGSHFTRARGESGAGRPGAEQGGWRAGSGGAWCPVMPDYSMRRENINGLCSIPEPPRERKFFWQGRRLRPGNARACGVGRGRKTSLKSSIAGQKPRLLAELHHSRTSQDPGGWWRSRRRRPRCPGFGPGASPRSAPATPTFFPSWDTTNHGGVQ